MDLLRPCVRITAMDIVSPPGLGAPLREPGRRAVVSTMLAVAALLAATPSVVAAQSLLDVLAAVRQGGGWVGIPIERGRGKVLTRALPAAGMELSGCMQVWHGHSGRWDIRAADTYTSQRLEARVVSGEPMPFAYETGAWAQLDVEVRWSEPRDTTLLLWVGLERRGRSARDPCVPVYGSAEDRSSDGGAGAGG
jgi:hypothetical protein